MHSEAPRLDPSAVIGHGSLELFFQAAVPELLEPPAVARRQAAPTRFPVDASREVPLLEVLGPEQVVRGLAGFIV